MTAKQAIKAIILAQSLTNRFKITIKRIYYSESEKMIYIKTNSGIKIKINEQGKAKYV